MWRKCPKFEVTALCCRPQSEEKAKAMAAEQRCAPGLTDEDACYAAGGFDAVYIGTANHLHYAAAKKALEAGYHVILEKPFTATAAEARELFELADRKGVILFEAITTPYLPAYRFLQDNMAAIGPVRGAWQASVPAAPGMTTSSRASGTRPLTRPATAAPSMT